jgi:CPA2 family monovalent cation:H+ antiporter-2
MLPRALAAANVSLLFVELGAAIVGLAILARLANRIGFSAIPLYLVGGLCFGRGGLLPLGFSESFIETGAEIGVLLLLFMLGLEYTGEELRHNLRLALPAGVADFVLNFVPGFAAALLLGWHVVPAVLLGGVTWVSSSAIIAKMLSETSSAASPETPSILSVLVLEDLAMAVYLPAVSAAVLGGGPAQTAASVTLALATVALVLLIALRFGDVISHWFRHESDEVALLTSLGIVVLAAGVAQHFHVSAAVGAFLVGVAFSGPFAQQSRRLVAPLRDFFAATFFLFFGLQIDPSSLPPVLPTAGALAFATASTKVITGYLAGKRSHLENRARWRAGVALIPRGEFSIVIAGLGAALEPTLGPLSAAYVLLLAVFGPILARLIR